MSTLLQSFETPVVRDGETWIAYLHGRDRADGTWEGWIEFVHATTGARLASPVETTQSSSDAVLYWATGLGAAYFDGALDRARDHTHPRPEAAPVRVAPPLVEAGTDRTVRDARREELEQHILGIFRRHQLVHHVLRNALSDEIFSDPLVDAERTGRNLVRRAYGTFADRGPIPKHQER